MPFSFFRRPRPADGEPLSDARPSSHRWGRWALVLAAVLALHWSAARWIGGSRTVSNPPPVDAPVQVALLTPKPVEQAPAPAPAAAPKPAPTQPKPQPKPSAPVLSVARDDANAQPAAAPATSSALVAASQAATPAPATPAAPSPAAVSGDKFDVPPTGELRYDTLVNGVTNQPGTIHWVHDGPRYEMIVSIPIPFVGPYVYSSHGHIDAFGIAPEQYSEQRGRRAADVTIFNRESKQLVYTRTPASQPLADGAQDRFSVFMQLASLVRGAADKYTPGVARQFSVADNDSSEAWTFETVGDETVQARGGPMSARHFTRLPRREGDRRRIDVWLAPSLGWLPARIVQTEPNGLQMELLWRGKPQPPAPAEGAQSGGPGTQNASDESAPAATQTERP